MSQSSSNTSTETGPVFFWREFEKPYGFLSQWYESTFEHEGVNYTSTEMWMMYQKAKLFGDEVCLHHVTVLLCLSQLLHCAGC